MIVIRRADMSDKDIARFLSRIDKSGDCWAWTGNSRISHGVERGRISFKGKYVYAYRFSYAYFNGECPTNLQIDHMCHNTMCVNPAHLQAVTDEENKQNINGAHKNNKYSRIRGVQWHKKSKKWRVRVTVNSVEHYCGLFDSIEEAEQTAIRMRNKLMTNNLMDRANERIKP